MYSKTEFKAQLSDIGLFMNDSLNFHTQQLSILRKTGHMEVLYTKDQDFITKEQRKDP